MEGSSDLSGTGILKPQFQNDGAHTTSVDVTYHNSEYLTVSAPYIKEQTKLGVLLNIIHFLYL